MKTLFTISVRVTRPFPTPDDEKIRADYAATFAQTIKETIKSELDNLSIPGLNVEVKVR